METKEEEALQEVVYKPTTQENDPQSLKPEEAPTTSSFLYFAAFIANLLAITCGIGLAWTSPVIPKLLIDPNNTNISAENDNPLGYPVTHAEASWLGGLAPLGGILSPIVAGWLVPKIGPKHTLLVIALPMVTSLVFVAFASTILQFYVSRFMIGLGVGSTFAVLPIYLAEIAEDHNRGTLGCSLGMFVAIGILCSFGIGPYLTIKNFSLVCAIPLAIFIPVFFLWIPEAPQFLAAANKNEELAQSLRKFRDKSDEEISKEISNITKAVYDTSANKASFGDLFKSRGLKRGLIVGLGIISLQQFSGINAVLAYMQDIFEAAGGSMAPEVSTIIIGVIQVFATVMTSALVDRLGRRILLLASASISCISLVALGLYFYLKDTSFDVSTIGWLPVSSLVVFIVAFNLGLGPLPWAVIAELFPSEVKSVACTIGSVVCFTESFLVTFGFQSLVLYVGMAKSFWLFSSVLLAGTVFIYVMLPETKGKGNQEIQRLLEEGKK